MVLIRKNFNIYLLESEKRPQDLGFGIFFDENYYFDQKLVNHSKIVTKIIIYSENFYMTIIEK